MVRVDGIIKMPRKKISQPVVSQSLVKKTVKTAAGRHLMGQPAKNQELVYQQELKRRKSQIKKQRPESLTTVGRPDNRGRQPKPRKALGVAIFAGVLVLVLVIWGFSLKRNLTLVREQPKNSSLDWQRPKKDLQETITALVNGLQQLGNLPTNANQVEVSGSTNVNGPSNTNSISKNSNSSGQASNANNFSQASQPINDNASNSQLLNNLNISNEEIEAIRLKLLEKLATNLNSTNNNINGNRE